MLTRKKKLRGALDSGANLPYDSFQIIKVGMQLIRK